MGPWLEILRRHRVVRASAAAIFLYGFAGAATSPYQSLIAIRELGMSDRAYAALSLTSSLAYVAMAIAVGLISDRYRSYRRPLIFVTSFGIIGYGMVWAFPSVPSFALATLLPLALFHSTNSMLFGNVRAVSDRFDPEEARIANALMRMMISLSWVVMPGAVGLLLAGRQSMIGAYLIAALVAAAILLVVTFWLEPDTRHLLVTEVLPEGEVAPEPVTRPAALQDLRLVLAPGLLLRVLGVALISQMLHINGAVLPLIVTGSAHGQPEDVGFLVGLVAVLEVIFMVFWAAGDAPPCPDPCADDLRDALPRLSGGDRPRLCALAGLCRQPSGGLCRRGDDLAADQLSAGSDQGSAGLVGLADRGEYVRGRWAFGRGLRAWHRAWRLWHGGGAERACRLCRGGPADRSGKESRMSRILLEVCVDDAAGISAAAAGGADRIELCAALALGGLTPSAGLISLASECGLPCMAMIRPRAGDFVWSPAERRAMQAEIAAVRQAGLAGVVIGASLPDGRLDKDCLARADRRGGRFGHHPAPRH